MTFTRFFGFGFLLWLLLAVGKALFLNVLNLDSLWLQFLYAVFVFVVAVACTRRLGVINYLEGAMVAILWTVGVLLGDVIFLWAIFRWEIFVHLVSWIGYLLTVIAIFLFHKKRHVQVRKELAEHHGHH